MSTKTLDYYNQNATKFVDGTIDVEFTETQDKFLALLKPGAQILDFGCGSGRDTKYFLEKGFKVDATDGSEELCNYASELTGTNVHCMLFEDLTAENIYDGIWACSSILHVEKKNLSHIFDLMVRALKDHGVIYTSFKYSNFEGERHGRYFTDFTEDTFQEFVKTIPGIQIEQYWVSGDVRPGRGDEKWLNLFLRKK